MKKNKDKTHKAPDKETKADKDKKKTQMTQKGSADGRVYSRN